MEIDERITILNSKKPFPKYTQNSLAEDFKLRFIYHSINIEGSTLNLLETKVILEGITVNNHSLEEHLMVTRLERVYEYIINTQKNGEPFNSKELCTLTEITDMINKTSENIDFTRNISKETTELAKLVEQKFLIV